MKKKISFAALQSAITCPGITELTGVSTISDTKQSCVEMELDGDWLHVYFKGREVLIHGANTKDLVVKEEIEKIPEKRKN